MITIQIFLDMPSADLARSYLEANGVAAFITADNEGGLNPGLSFGTGVRLMVLENELELAQNLMEQYQI